jgi:molecular chaperone DnaK
MDVVVGIDLGTTNSLIGVMEAGFPILIADANGERLTPSVVHFPEEGESLVGQAAAHMRMLKPAETVYSIKRFIGVRAEELRDDEAEVGYELLRRKSQSIRVKIRDREYKAEEISALILGKLKRDAEVALGREVSHAVITVPAYFNDAQRNATKAAGDLAGFTVERIVNEPTAAALAYGLDKLKEKSHIAVYDLGGGTFDISILELNEGVFEVLATNGNTRLGGDDIDAALLRTLLGSAGFQPAAFGILPNAQTRRQDASDSEQDARAPQTERLRDEIVAAKHRLSIDEQVAISVPFFENDKVFFANLTRDQLEKIARPIIERTRNHCLRALADAKISPEDLDEVILVGGVTRMPLVRQFVAEIFGRQPNTSQNPDEAVAIGATIQAGILSGAVRDVVLLDVTPLSLGIETFGGLMNVIIPRNSTIPTRAGEMFTTAVTNQTSMLIKVLQGEREMARDNWPLGQFEIGFERAAKGVARVGVQFEIDADGILHVLARDVKTGAEKMLEVKSAIDVSDEAVEKMLAESLDHAFEDVSERVWTETQLKSQEMLRAVDSALAITGDQLDAAEKEMILQSATVVREALESHETARLKEANEALDRATQGLAALMVENAMAGSSSQTKLV